MGPDRANEGNVISPFDNAARDASHAVIQFAKLVVATDDTPTSPVPSPLTGTSPITLNIPGNAVAIILVHDATTVTSTITFNGGSGTFGLVANQTVTLPCAGETFTTLAINPGAGVSLYFAFELI